MRVASQIATESSNHGMDEQNTTMFTINFSKPTRRIQRMKAIKRTATSTTGSSTVRVFIV
jgi:hypothetical protein